MYHNNTKTFHHFKYFSNIFHFFLSLFLTHNKSYHIYIFSSFTSSIYMLNNTMSIHVTFFYLHIDTLVNNLKENSWFFCHKLMFNFLISPNSFLFDRWSPLFCRFSLLSFWQRHLSKPTYEIQEFSLVTSTLTCINSKFW